MPKLTLTGSSRFLWALVLVTLPITSFKYMPFMGSGTFVRPLSLYPLFFLFPLLLLKLKRKEIVHPWPGPLIIALAFFFAVLAATAIGATFSPIELRNVGFLDRALRAFVTLILGISFFIAAIWMNQNESDLKFSVKWLMAGLIAHLLWGAIQFIGLNTGFRKQLFQIQNLFSVRGLVKNKRISGFAYEPSWLAGQLATLYIPWLFASVLTKYRIFQPSIKTVQTLLSRLTPLIEPALLLAALTGLLMTYSRSGLLITSLAAIATTMLAGKPALLNFWEWMRAGFNPSKQRDTFTTFWQTGTRILLVILLLISVFGTGLFLADKGYIAVFFNSDSTDIYDYFQNVYLGPRLAYAFAALKTFEIHPFTGTGLGASGFQIYDNMPDWALSGEPEIARQMSPSSDLYPNPKNIYVRLLAETGIIGFTLFTSIYLALLADILSLYHHPDAKKKITTNFSNPSATITRKWLASAGLFALTAIILQGISQDSFAMPEMWINLGILAGTAGMFNRTNLSSKEII